MQINNLIDKLFNNETDFESLDKVYRQMTLFSNSGETTVVWTHLPHPSTRAQQNAYIRNVKRKVTLK